MRGTYYPDHYLFYHYLLFISISVQATMARDRYEGKSLVLLFPEPLKLACWFLHKNTYMTAVQFAPESGEMTFYLKVRNFM